MCAELQDLLPGIINQLGPDNLANLKKLAETYQSGGAPPPAAGADDDEDVRAARMHSAASGGASLHSLPPLAAICLSLAQCFWPRPVSRCQTSSTISRRPRSRRNVTCSLAPYVSPFGLSVLWRQLVYHRQLRHMLPLGGGPGTYRGSVFVRVMCVSRAPWRLCINITGGFARYL